MTQLSTIGYKTDIYQAETNIPGAQIVQHFVRISEEINFQTVRDLVGITVYIEYLIAGGGEIRPLNQSLTIYFLDPILRPIPEFLWTGAGVQNVVNTSELHFNSNDNSSFLIAPVQIQKFQMEISWYDTVDVVVATGSATAFIALHVVARAPFI